MASTTPPESADHRATLRTRRRCRQNGQMTLRTSARELSGSRFVVSPLLEVLAAGEALCGQDPALRGWRRRNPAMGVGRRHARDFVPAAVRRLVAERLLRHRSEAALRTENEFSVLGPLEQAAREFFQDCLVRDWPRIRGVLEADVALRAHDLAARGVRRVVEGLPDLTVREVLDEPGGAERGLVLVPSAFRRASVLLSDETGTVVAYPAAGRHRLWEEPDPVGPAPLGSLLGRGRAAALLSIGAGCGTTELAGRLAVSAGTASVHVAALRNGGLVATHRVGKAVKHVLTPVGSALITAQPTGVPSTI